jgi:acetolactate synthase-1/2/3 large subunit
MKLSDYVIDFLVSKGVTHVFEVAGGSITHLLDSLYDRKDIQTVCMHHEQSASFAAEGYARISGKPGVAMATSGPGATNLITGIGSCFFDSVPALFITGQVNTYEFKFDRPVRQVGFQETDIISIVKPIVKDALLVIDEAKIRYELERLFDIACSGRPGPVLVDLPMNIQRANITPSEQEAYARSRIESGKLSDDVIDEIFTLIEHSQRPVVIIGGGIRLSGAIGELYCFAQKTGIPIVSSLMGLDAFPHDDELYVGMIGTYGNRYANLTLANSDLVIALGTRLDSRQTGTNPESFARYATIVHVDLDPSELNSKIQADIAINDDVQKFLAKLNNWPLGRKNILPWMDRIKQYVARYPDYVKPENNEIPPNYFMHELSENLPEDAILCVDIGQNQMWSAQSIVLKKGQRLLTEGGMASMGSALPMAIGASFACPGRLVAIITGDGGFQLNIQELQTVYHHDLPIKIILLNNRSYGMIRQFQDQYFDGRYQSTVVGYSCPDFQKVVAAYSIPVARTVAVRNVAEGLKWLFVDKKPKFLEVLISDKSVVTPKLAVNKPIEEQDPPLSPDELRSNMVTSIRENEKV